MKLFGFELVLRKKDAGDLQSVAPYSWLNSWWGGPIRESFPGAWQKNITIDSETSLLAFSAIFACVTGIASDIAKMRIKLTQNRNGIWEEIHANQPWLPVLRKPNHFQTRIEFIEQWIISKLLSGNAYILKERQDKRGIVTRMYVLDPRRVTPLVADDGSVFYRLQRDYLSQVTDDDPAVPASEIIHDKMCCLWHPLVGVSPLYACAMSGTMGNKIQANSTNLFGNRSMPGGILSTALRINDETAKRMKAEFETNFSGANVGRIAVLGDGLKFEASPMMTAEAAQLIEQLKWTVEDVARAFHYPKDKLGGDPPPYASNAEARTMVYYMDCLQTLIEKIELCLDEGLELAPYGTEMDLDNLWRMDTAALYEANNKAADWMKIDEQRARANLAPLPVGGNTVYRQQQDYSIEAIAKRDAQPDPFKSNTPTPPPPTPPPTPEKPALPAPADKKDVDIDYLKFRSASKLRKELVPA